MITAAIGGSSAWLARIDSGVSRLISAEQRDQSSPDGGCWGHCPGRSTSVSQFHITTQDDLPGPDGDEPYVLFVNQTE